MAIPRIEGRTVLYMAPLVYGRVDPVPVINRERTEVTFRERWQEHVGTEWPANWRYPSGVMLYFTDGSAVKITAAGTYEPEGIEIAEA